MAGEHPLAGLLDRAGNVFTLAGELGRTFHEQRSSRSRIHDTSIWQRHAPTFNKFHDAILELREPMRNPPDGFAPVAEQLLKVARIAKGIRDTLDRDHRFPAYLDFFPDLNTVCQSGWETIKEATKAQRLDNPFAFVDEPAGSPYSLLDRFPATPAGHVAFLEWVLGEVHGAAEAKHGQFQRGYSNATIESMIGGIMWAEAGRRVSSLSDLSADAVEQVARVLRRELTSGTVGQIDELLTPAVRKLRDAWENRGVDTDEILESAKAEHAEVVKRERALREAQRRNDRLWSVQPAVNNWMHEFANGNRETVLSEILAYGGILRELDATHHLDEIDSKPSNHWNGCFAYALEVLRCAAGKDREGVAELLDKLADRDVGHEFRDGVMSALDGDLLQRISTADWRASLGPYAPERPEDRAERRVREREQVNAAPAGKSKAGDDGLPEGVRREDIASVRAAIKAKGRTATQAMLKSWMRQKKRGIAATKMKPILLRLHERGEYDGQFRQGRRARA